MYSVLEYLNVQHPFFIYLGINGMKCVRNRNEWMIPTMLHASYHLFVTHLICSSSMHYHHNSFPLTSQSLTKNYKSFKLLLLSVIIIFELKFVKPKLSLKRYLI